MCGVTALGIYADENTISNSLSVDQALVLALATHPLIQSAEGQFKAAKSELNASRWGRFPTIATGTQESSDKIKKDSTTVSMPLWVGGRINAEIDLAKNLVGMELFPACLRRSKQSCWKLCRSSSIILSLKRSYLSPVRMLMNISVYMRLLKEEWRQQPVLMWMLCWRLQDCNMRNLPIFNQK